MVLRGRTDPSGSENPRASTRRRPWAIFLGSGLLVVLLAGLCNVSGLDWGLGPVPVILQTLPVTTPLCGTWHTTSTAQVVYGGLNAVTAFSATDVWTVGVDKSAPLIQHWDGNRWQTVASNAPSAARLMAVAGTRADDVWAAGYTDSNGQGHSTVVHWIGHKWQRSAVPQTGERGSMLLGLTGVSPTDVWAVGNYTALRDGLNHPLILHWDGNQWSQSGTTDLPPSIGWLYNELLSVVAGVGGQLWALGSYSNDPAGTQASTLALRWSG